MFYSPIINTISIIIIFVIIIIIISDGEVNE